MSVEKRTLSESQLPCAFRYSMW